MNYRYLIALLFVSTLLSCQSDDQQIEPDTQEGTMYFPPIGTNEWESTSATELNWNYDKLEDLKGFLIADNTKSFMVLVNGKIVVEEYFNGHNSTETWQWNSAGKTLVTAITGITK